MEEGFELTFVVLSYNSAKTILQTLESIKYQVERYGSGKRIQLVVADDGSTDDTQALIRKFASKNLEVFDKIDLSFSSCNLGTCRNSTRAYRMALGNFIFPIAGDDMLTNTDVISEMMKCSPDEIVICPPLKFQGINCIVDEKAYYGDIISAIRTNKDVHRRILFSCTIMNGSLAGRNVYDEDVCSFIENFTLLEDWARFFKALTTKEIKIRSSNNPILLYRLSPEQVTQKKGAVRKLIGRDLMKLKEFALAETKNPFRRMRIRLGYLKWTNPSFYHRYWPLFAYYEYIDYFSYKIREKMISKHAKLLIKHGQECKIDDYIRQINNRVKEYFY